MTSWRTGRCWCIAHRGGAAEARENTLEAFRHAVAVGADMVETDARRSRDGAAVVCHDERLDRTTAAAGPVAAFDAGALAALGVPTLAEALAACAPLPVTLELKEEAALEPTAAAVEASGRPDQVIVGSFDDARLAAWRTRMPGRPTSLSEGEAGALIEDALRGRSPRPAPDGAVALQVPRRHEGLELVTPAVVAAAHELELAVHVWTVDDPAAMRELAALGVDGLITDRPTVLRALLDGRPPPSAGD